MALTPETLPRHELNGLRVEVVDASNPDLVGIAGRVVVETMQTFHIECVPSETERDGDGDSEAQSASDRASGRGPRAEAVEADGESRVRQVPKQGSTFEFVITDEAAASARTAGTASEPEGASGHAGNDVAHVTVDGARLLSRPALRTEHTGDSLWR